jgi:hypothetical protein
MLFSPGKLPWGLEKCGFALRIRDLATAGRYFD